MRRVGAIICFVVSSLLLAGGTAAGIVNREVVDGGRFAQHVDTIRLDANVSQQIGNAITNRIVAADPNLIALRPLLEASATSIVSSPSFGSIFRAAVRELHSALTQEGSGQVVLRLADVGSLLTGVIRAVSPSTADALPDDLDVTLASVGDQSFAATTIDFARQVRLLDWLLPLLALVAFGLGAVLTRERRRLLRAAAFTALGSGAIIGVTAGLTALFASSTGRGDLHGAIVGAALEESTGLIWTPAVVLLILGCALLVADSLWFAGTEQGLTWSMWFERRPRSQLIVGVRAGFIAVFGGWIVVRPLDALQALAVLTGLGLLVYGLTTLARVLAARWRQESAPRRVQRMVRARWLPRAATLLPAVGVVALVVVLAWPQPSSIPAASSGSSNPRACNGYVQLCNRRYNDVAYPASHNSMSAADQPGWFLAEQPNGLVAQLNAGIRVLLIDTWYGQTTTRKGLITNPSSDRDAARQAAVDSFGVTAVDSALRLVNGLAPTAVGPPEPYLCHGVCEIGATKWEPVMASVRSWLAAHPREVVTFFIEDSVSPEDTAKVFDQAGLLPYVHTQKEGDKWPTLEQMIDSNRRVVVLMQRHGGGAKIPWLLQGFDWAHDTNYDATTVAQLGCTLNRGKANSSLLLINNWLNNFDSIVTDAARVNAIPQLSDHLRACQTAFGQIPNFVAVNYYSQGDLFRAVNELNRV